MQKEDLVFVIHPTEEDSAMKMEQRWNRENNMAGRSDDRPKNKMAIQHEAYQ